MRPIYLKTFILGTCLVLYSLNLPEIVRGATFGSTPPSVNFGSITLKGEKQEISGGIGSIVVNGQLLGGLLTDNWDLSVHAGRLTYSFNPSDPTKILQLPFNSLRLTPPKYYSGTRCNTRNILINTATYIDTVENSIKIISGSCGSLLGIFGSCTFTFDQPPFILTIDPSVKMIIPGNPATYQSTITWTLTSAGIL